MRNIILYGPLGRKFGRYHQFNVNTVQEAVGALRANHEEFARYIMDMEFTIFTDTGDTSVDEINFPSRGDIKMVPIVCGAKSSFFKIIVGAALFFAAPYLPTSTLFTIGKTAVSISSIVGGIGASMAIGGVGQLLSPVPGSRSTPDAPDNKPSFTFDGVVNTAAQGNVIPVLYGKLRVGSLIVSNGLRTQQLPA